MHKKSSNSVYMSEFIFLIKIIKNNLLSYKFLFSQSNIKSKIFDFKTFLKSVFNIIFWTKIRVLYFVNNWIYTTNHKRIAVNYFWFVILSGVVGMVLATLIRLEFAYPGVGIFAGDSLQYLSMATAHGVIMVFFMIMPLLFGAFANFLIPTQLGVHDVAFPRLNSAAFWFLPGGLLMLCQLVCIDRRYQRMNCFNIREIQSILKRKFFTDLINSHDHHVFLDKTAMGLRFKTNNINNINNNITIFYNYGIEFTPKLRSTFFFNNVNKFNNDVSFFNYNSFFFSFISLFSNYNIFYLLNFIYLFFYNTLFSLTTFTLNFKNLFISVFYYILLIYENLDYFYYHFFDYLYLYFSTFFFIFYNHKSFISSFIHLISPIHLLSLIFDFIYLFFYNNVYFFFNILYSKNILTLNFLLSYIFNTLNNCFYDFFFYIKFFEIFYFYKTNLFNFFFIFLNYLNISNYDSYFFIFFYKIFDYSFNFSQIFNFTNDKLFYSSENVLIKNINNNFKTNVVLFNDNFNSKLNYNSYFSYIFVIIYSIYNIPLFFFNFFKNIFDFNSWFNLITHFYFLIISWYVPFLLIDNIFYSFYKNLDFYNFEFSNKYNSMTYLFNKISFLFSNLYYLNTNNFGLFKFILYNFIWFFNNIFNFIVTYIKLISYFFNSFSIILFSQNTNVVFSFIYDLFFIKTSFINNQKINLLQNSYNSNYFNNTNIPFLNQYSNEENSNVSRYLRFYNPVFKYDFKSGNYFPKLYKQVYSFLFITMAEAAGSLRNAPWFFSSKYIEYFNTNFLNYVENISNFSKFSNFTLHSWNTTRFNSVDAFFNFFYILSNDNDIVNKKWIALDSLNQKFYKMFNTSSMQQRIYSNWRQLKFTREAWRCKLLAARHQKTLFRRYFHEDEVFWSIERNAKDLLPGWAMITPFSSRTKFTAVGKTDIGLMGVFLVLNSSIISGANFLVTYRYLSTLNNRKMRDARVFFTESIIVACWMMIFANPMLAIAILMLLSDRHWQTSFFDYSGGGDTVLFQHMFWFFGHPEVYVIIIPTFGFTNSMISYYLRKRVSARASLMYSMYTIAFLGFFVWGHHMYMVGLSHTTRMLFSTLTVMISVPAATKIMHWCVTTVNSSIALELPLLFTFTFIFLFVSGGISGMCVAHTGMDVLFHDTFYVIGHFHVMLAGAAMFGSFGAFYFYFPAIFGVKYSRIYAYLHYSYYLLGQLMTVIPMFWLGYAGMPRRVLDYPASMGGWHSVVSAGHLLSVAGLIAFFIMIFDSLRQGKAVIRNTFGISRYNTRLNFYLYEISRLVYIQQKTLTLFRFTNLNSVKLNNLNYINFEPLETTLINYTFIKK